MATAAAAVVIGAGDECWRLYACNRASLGVLGVSRAKRTEDLERYYSAEAETGRFILAEHKNAACGQA